MRVCTNDPYHLWTMVQSYCPCDMYVPTVVPTSNLFTEGSGFQWVLWDGLAVPHVVYIRRLSWQP